MTLQVCTFDGKPFLVGLEWQSTPIEGSPTRIKEQERRARKALGNIASVTLRKGTYSIIGHATKAQFKAVKKASKHPSATALLTMAAPEGARWIVKQTLQDGRVWIGVLIDGVPYADADRVIDAETADQFVSTLQATDDYEVFEDSLGELIGKIDKKGAAQALVAIQSEEAIKVLLMIVGIASVGVAGYFGYGAYMDGERRRWLTSQSEASERAAKEQAQREEQKRYNERIQELASKLRKTSAQGQINAWMVAINPLALDAAKWGLNSVSCTTSSCTLTYQRGKGLLQRFMEQFPDAKFDLSKPNEASLTLKLQGVAPALTQQELKGELNPKMLATIGQLMHMASNASVQFNPTAAQADDITFAKKGGWSASGSRFNDIRDLSELFDKYGMSPNFTIQTMALKVDGNQLNKWELKGEYVFLGEGKDKAPQNAKTTQTI